MDSILRDVAHAFVYLDEILVALSSPTEHLEDLQFLFNILKDNGMIINRAKCVLGTDSVKFLGHTILAAGITLLPSMVSAVRDFPHPVDIPVLQ